MTVESRVRWYLPWLFVFVVGVAVGNDGDLPKILLAWSRALFGSGDGRVLGLVAVDVCWRVDEWEWWLWLVHGGGIGWL